MSLPVGPSEHTPRWAEELAQDWEREIEEFATKDDPYYNGVRACLSDLRANLPELGAVGPAPSQGEAVALHRLRKKFAEYRDETMSSGGRGGKIEVQTIRKTLNVVVAELDLEIGALRAALCVPHQEEYGNQIDGCVSSESGRGRADLRAESAGQTRPGVGAAVGTRSRETQLRAGEGDGGARSRGQDGAVADQEISRLGVPAQEDAPSWLPIETAPRDGTMVYVYAAEREGLPPFITVAAYHPDAGWCVDELREATHWMPRVSSSGTLAGG